MLKRKDDKIQKVDDVFVIKTNIISSYNDGSGCGPLCFDTYFLAKQKKDKYYELFTGKLLKQTVDGSKVSFQTFDTPYIKEIKPLKEYLKIKNETHMESELLFDFLISLNSYEMAQIISKK